MRSDCASGSWRHFSTSSEKIASTSAACGVPLSAGLLTKGSSLGS